MRGIFVTGTDTGCGKTEISLGLMAALQRRGLSVQGTKPVASGCERSAGRLINEDASRLRAQSSRKVPYELVNPYAAPAAPMRAEAVSDRTPDRWQKPLAGRGARLVASIIDGVLNIAACVPGMLVLFLMEEQFANEDHLFYLGGGLAVFGLMAVNIYQWFLLTRDGQSLGKKAVGVRIVMHQTGRNPGFGRAVGLRIWLNSLIGMLPGIGRFYGLIDVLFIFGSEGRCLHDLIAGTSVIDLRAADIKGFGYGGRGELDSQQVAETLAQLDREGGSVQPQGSNPFQSDSSD